MSESALDKVLDEIEDEEVLADEQDDDELLELDLSEAGEEWTALNGDYPVEVIEAKAHATKGSATKNSIKLQMRVLEGSPLGGVNRRLFKILMMGGKGTAFTRRFAKGFGLDIDFDATPVKLKPSMFLGAKGIAVCTPDKREQYAAETEVSSIKPYTDPDAVDDE